MHASSYRGYLLCRGLQFVSPQLHQSLDDLQVVSENATIGVVAVQHEVLQQSTSRFTILC